MHTLSFITQKGGAGKSTLALSVAVAAVEAGEHVAIFDLDPQQSLVKWAASRKKTDIMVEAVAPEALPQWRQFLIESGITLCIVDTAGADPAAASAAIEASNLCLIPARPNVFDLWAGETTRRAVRSLGKEALFLLNQCPPVQQSARVNEGVRVLEATGILMSPLISSRVDFQDAARAGLGVTEINRSGQAAEEIRKLWASIRHVLNADADTGQFEAPADLAAPDIGEEFESYLDTAA